MINSVYESVIHSMGRLTSLYQYALLFCVVFIIICTYHIIYMDCHSVHGWLGVALSLRLSYKLAYTIESKSNWILSTELAVSRLTNKSSFLWLLNKLCVFNSFWSSCLFLMNFIVTELNQYVLSRAYEEKRACNLQCVYCVCVILLMSQQDMLYLAMI